MKRRRGPLAAFLLAFLIAVVSVILISHVCAGFKGTDNQGSEIISSISPGYTPWCGPIGLAPEKDQEILLFSLQAGLGAGVLAYGLTLLNNKNSRDDG